MSGNARSDEIDTKFRQTARMIMDLTILANFSQIAQSEINSVEVKISATFRQPWLLQFCRRLCKLFTCWRI